MSCFKAYDIRGRVGIDLDEAIVRRIGRAFADVIRPRTVVVGRDCRESSPALAAALIAGLRDGGTDVIDLGLAGTEEVYFATSHFAADGGLEVTASHNPIDYNGIKLVGQGSRPIAPEELLQVRAIAEADDFRATNQGSLRQDNPRAAYARKIADFADAKALRPLTLLVNAGNGVAGPAFDAVVAELERRGAMLRIIRINHTPDGRFPNGIPNPMLVENQPMTGDAVLASGADLGIAWDGDFDRCFLFDETGRMVEGEYIVGLLAAAFLADAPESGRGSRIVHDPRIVLNTRAVIAAHGGEAVASKTGHVLIKQTMRAHDAVYGGEMSAHHYFRDFMYCDSGMIPWLKVIALMSATGQPLSALIGTMRAQYPSSGERNFTVRDAEAIMSVVLETYGPQARVDRLDGLSFEFDDWRMNLRTSNTEPLLRLNIESRGDAALVAARVAEIEAIIRLNS